MIAAIIAVLRAIPVLRKIVVWLERVGWYSEGQELGEKLQNAKTDDERDKLLDHITDNLSGVRDEKDPDKN